MKRSKNLEAQITYIIHDLGLLTTVPFSSNPKQKFWKIIQKNFNKPKLDYNEPALKAILFKHG